MDKIKLKNAILEVPNTSIEENNQIFTISTGMDIFKAVVDTDKIEDFDFMISPAGQICVALKFNDGGMIIVMPNDFVFDVVQKGAVEISNLPQTCSLRGLAVEMSRYGNDPEPSDNIDVNIGMYFMYKYLIQSAKNKGFDVSIMLKQLTDAIKGRELSTIVANMEGNS